MKQISVIMAVYNEPESFVSLAIDSILSQTFRDFEFIIILDNPLNTKIKDFLYDYSKKDARIKILVNDKNMGLAMSLNRGIEIAEGKYIARMDADDVSMPERLEKQYAYMEANPDIDILSTIASYIDKDGDTIGKARTQTTKSWRISKILNYINILFHSSVLMRKDKIVSIGAYRDFPTSQDRDLWCRAIYSGMKLSFMNEYLIKYRINHSGISESKAFRQALISSYIKKLNKERRKTGKDSFSLKALNAYCEENGIKDSKENEKFVTARDYFNEARIEIKTNPLRGIYMLSKSFMGHRLIRERIINITIATLIKGKLSN